MIKIENYEVVGWEHAIRGMRNPKNSWDRSDSEFNECGEGYIGPNDYDLMMRLAKGGPVHAKYRRMITVYVDITAPLYWWKEFDTYKVGTVANSCSTMHKIHDKEFTLDDFSHEHLMNLPYAQHNPLEILNNTIRELNYWRDIYNKEVKGDSNCSMWILGDGKVATAKDFWHQMIQLLPTSYNQKRTIMMNYEVLTGIYEHRRNHKLDEWHTLCDWIKELPYSEIITGEEKCLVVSEGMNDPS